MAAWPPEWIRQALNTVLTTTGDIAYRAASGVTRLAIGTTGARLVVNGSGVPVWIPIGTVAMAAYDVDFAAGLRFTKTITSGQTLTFSNETWGHQGVVVRLTNSGVTTAPALPSGAVRIGTGAWVTTDAVVNRLVIIRYATGDYEYTVSQDA